MTISCHERSVSCMIALISGGLTRTTASSPVQHAVQLVHVKPEVSISAEISLLVMLFSFMVEF